MTRRLDKVKMDKVRGPNPKLVTNRPEAQNENKDSNQDKIWRLQMFIFKTFRAVLKTISKHHQARMKAETTSLLL